MRHTWTSSSVTMSNCVSKLLLAPGALKSRWYTHPSFSNSPLQSTTGPPLPMRSRVCKLTGNESGDIKVREEGHWAGDTERCRVKEEQRGEGDRKGVKIMYSCVQPYLLSAPALRRCPRGSVYIDLVAGLEGGGNKRWISDCDGESEWTFWSSCGFLWI